MDDGYFIINEDQGNDENNVTARFELHATLHPAKSHAAGRPVYVDTPIVYIRVKDDETNSRIPHIVTDEHKQRFPKEWKAFEASIADVEIGSPLRMWPPITPAKLKEFQGAGILTVEQLSEASDKQIGAEADVWRRRAREWLNPNEELDKLRAELAALKGKRGNNRKDEDDG